MYTEIYIMNKNWHIQCPLFCMIPNKNIYKKEWEKIEKYHQTPIHQKMTVWDKKDIRGTMMVVRNRWDRWWSYDEVVISLTHQTHQTPENLWWARSVSSFSEPLWWVCWVSFSERMVGSCSKKFLKRSWTDHVPIFLLYFFFFSFCEVQISSHTFCNFRYMRYHCQRLIQIVFLFSSWFS